MRHLLLNLIIICSALLAVPTAKAQEPKAQACDYTLLMKQGDALYAKQDYRAALKKYNAARICDPGQGAAVDVAIDKLFTAIEKQRDDAKRQRERAEAETQKTQKEKNRADSLLKVTNMALNYAKDARKTADSLLSITLTEKARAVSILAAFRTVVGQSSFYEGRFGLTLREENSRIRYGYIDPQGKEVIPFEYEEASPFSQDGFARVKKDGISYLIDTSGTTYLLASSLADLSPETEALDLHENLPDFLPEDIGKYGKLKVILAYGQDVSKGKVRYLPASIGQLSQLYHLDLHNNLLSSLRPEIGQLSKLRELNLLGNQLTILPAEIGQLDVLQKLDLSYNQLRTLPNKIGQLKTLQELNLSHNQLQTLPKEIGQLNMWRKLDLSHNQLQTLPKEIRIIPYYTDLILNDNLFSKDELERIQRLRTPRYEGGGGGPVFNTFGAPFEGN